MAQIIEFFGNHPYLLAALAGSLVFIVISEIRFRSGPKGLSAAEAVRAINDEDALVIDVRKPAEYSSGHILHAKNLPLESLGDEIGKLAKAKTQPIIAYCKSGSQSAAACQTLFKAGYEKASYLKSGLYGWQEANLPMEK